MEITKWYSKEECKENAKKFVEKNKAGTLDGKEDAYLYMTALWGTVYLSQEEEDDDLKMEVWENLEDIIEEYRSIGYFIEVRGSGKYILLLDPDNLKAGKYEGEYDENHPEFEDIKNKVWMEWGPDTQLQIMNGNPNTDAQFFSGDLKVKGSLKLASMPRELAYDFFDFWDLEAV